MHRDLHEGKPDIRSDVNESEVRAMVEASPDGMLLSDDLGSIVWANSRMESLFGFVPSDLVGMSVEDLVPERFRRAHRSHRESYATRPTTRPMGATRELWARRSDGSEFPVEVGLSPIVTRGLQRVVVTIRDASERYAAEADRRAVLRALDAASDAVFMIDVDSLKYRYVNEGAVGQLGYERSELLAMTPLQILPDYSETAFRELVDSLETGPVKSKILEMSHRRCDGEAIPVEVELEMSPAIAGQPKMLTAIARDTSERLRRQAAEEERAVSLQILSERERLAGDLHDLVIQRLFAAGMGLQSIQGLIADPVASDRLAETVGSLDAAIAELRASIFHLKSEDGNGLRSRVTRILGDSASRLGFEPKLNIKGDLTHVDEVTAENLVAALTEALSNVVRHAHASSVGVSLSVGGDDLEMVIEDDGVGIGTGRSRGQGLNNIERRAERLDGSCTVAPGNSGVGTRVVWRVGARESL